jgi:hypothetical protein
MIRRPDESWLDSSTRAINGEEDVVSDADSPRSPKIEPLRHGTVLMSPPMSAAFERKALRSASLAGSSVYVSRDAQYAPLRILRIFVTFCAENSFASGQLWDPSVRLVACHGLVADSRM